MGQRLLLNHQAENTVRTSKRPSVRTESGGGELKNAIFSWLEFART